MAQPLEMPSVSFIVARSRPGNIIGCENKLPWRLSTDLRRFKEVTLGHAIIMGRKTFESIGRVLPGRLNIVLSSRTPNDIGDIPKSLEDTALLWASDRENSLFVADIWSIAKGKKDFFVVGGSEVFQRFSDLFNKVYLTEVLADDIKGDATFDFEFKYPKWNLTHKEDIPAGDVDQYPSRYCILEKRDKTTRWQTFPNYLTDAEKRRSWVRRNLPELVGSRSKSKKDQAAWAFDLKQLID